MAKNLVHPGDVIEITSAGAIAAGAVVAMNSLIGIAQNAATGAGQRVTVALRGVYSVPKVGSQAWAIGAPVYWDAANNRFTSTAGSLKMAGVAWAEVGSGAGEITGLVRLNGGAATP